MTSEGKVFTFGQGENGLLGDGGNSPKKLPQQVVSLKDEHISQVREHLYVRDSLPRQNSSFCLNFWSVKNLIYNLESP